MLFLVQISLIAQSIMVNLDLLDHISLCTHYHVHLELSPLNWDITELSILERPIESMLSRNSISLQRLLMHQFISKIWDVSCQNSYHIIRPSFEDRHPFFCVGICCNSIQLIPVHMQIYSDYKNEYNNRIRLCLYMYY